MSTSSNPFEQDKARSADQGIDPRGWGNDHAGEPAHPSREAAGLPNSQPTADEPADEPTAQLGGAPNHDSSGFGGPHSGPTFAAQDHTGPSYSHQGYSDAGHTDSGYANQGYTDSGYTDPGYTDPGYADQGYTDPGFGAPHAQQGAWGSSYPGTGIADQSMGHASMGHDAMGHGAMGQGAMGQGAGGAGRPPVGADDSGSNRRPRRRGLLAIPAVALVAALGASGLTAAFLNTDSANSAGGTVTTRVVQGQTSAPDWSATASAASPSVVAIQVASRQASAEGSGVVLDNQGHIATNNHVVAAAGAGAALQVTDSQQHVYTATVVGTDPATDLAVIKIDNAPASLTPIAMGDADALTVGQPVMALGNPLGLSKTVTTGIISALDRPVITQQQSQQQGLGSDRTSLASQATQSVANAIQTNAAINPGNSGGALVNADGQLIGIPSSIASLGSSSSSSSESGNIGIGFAIPVNEVKSVTSQLIANGTAEHSWLGVASQDQVAQVDGANVRGAQLATVANDSPASSAGLQAKDVIIGVDKDPINGADALMAQIRDRQVGDKVTLRVVRDGQEQEIEVTLGTAPQ